MATVTPIFKKGDKSDPANYRPVSLTSILCKVLERIICEDIIAHLKTNNLIARQQHGFITGKSTVTNLLEALDIWTEALSHSLPVDVVFLDYAKAFDTVPHERLLAQVQALGVNAKTHQWIRSFLTGRRQRVNVNGSLSDWEFVTSGVPQGSVLGPLLFSMFVCDVPDLLNCHISMFADDTKVYQVINERDGELHNLQEDINSLQDWAKTMQMIFHPLKCKVMHLGPTNPGSEYTMTTMGGGKHTLEAVCEEKDLGVTIDMKLSFSKHVTNQINKANRILGAIKHTFANIDSDIFKALYKSIVRPHLEYATVIWSPKFKKDKDALEQVQRRATRLVNGLSHLSYSDRLRSLNLPTLEFRRKRSDIIETFKILKGFDKVDFQRECPCCHNSMFKNSLSRVTRGHDQKLQVQHQLGPRKAFFAARVTQTWNKLSTHTIDAPNVDVFKYRLGKEWKDHPEKFNYKFSY